MAQLKTIPFTSEVPVKEDGAYNFGAHISCTGISVPDGGITFGSGVYLAPMGFDTKMYSADAGGHKCLFSGMTVESNAGISASSGGNSARLNRDGSITASASINAGTSISAQSLSVGGGGISVTGSGGVTVPSGDYHEIVGSDTYYFSGDPSTGNVYYKQVSS